MVCFLVWVLIWIRFVFPSGVSVGGRLAFNGPLRGWARSSHFLLFLDPLFLFKRHPNPAFSCISENEAIPRFVSSPKLS